MVSEETRPTFTVKALADYLHVGKSAVYKLLHEGELPFIKIGRGFHIPRHSVMCWLNGNALLNANDNK